MTQLQPEDVRWHQRLDSYHRALAQLQKGLAMRAERPLNDLEQQGLIQAFEFTHEMAWNVMKDYLRSVGSAILIINAKSVVLKKKDRTQ